MLRSVYLSRYITDGLCFFYAAGSINVSNILTGKCLAKIKASDGFPGDALFCDEERNEVYTVNRNGLVHVWSKCTPNKRQKI